MPKKVLVVDDDPSMLELQTMRLELAGYEVGNAVTGEEALSKMRASRPDLILLDIMLPGMHGFEVCQAIRADRRLRKVKVIFISAKAYPADIKMSKTLGAVDFLVKPFEAETLLSAVDRATSGNGA